MTGPGGERRLVLLTGLVAALPVFVSIIRALSDGWVPVSDQAVAAARAYDVFTSWSPLVGPWSSSSIAVGEPVFHPGPMLYWLLAIPVRLSGSWTLLVTMGALNVAAVVGSVAVARRRGGRPLMFATAVAIAVMCSSLETRVLSDIWNPSAPILPMTLLIFVCWSVACGEYRLLPLAVVVASFAIQCHVVLLLPAAGMLGVAGAGLFASRAARADREIHSVRRWSIAALVAAVLCWSGPLLDQVLAWSGSSRGSGNLATLVEAGGARETPIGLTGGVHAVVRAVGVPPWWLRRPQPPLKRTFDIFTPLSTVAVVSTVAVLIGLVLMMALALRRRRTDVAVANGLALLLCVALAAVTASFPNTPETIFSYSYTSWWASPLGMWAWLVLAWSAVTLLAARLGYARMSGVRSAVALGAVAVVAATVAAKQRPDRDRDLYGPARTVAQRLHAELPVPGTVRVDSSVLDFTTVVVSTLRRRGATVTVRVDEFGPLYDRRNRRVDHVVDVRQGTALPAGARAVARVRPASARSGAVTVSVRRASPARGG